MLSAERLSSIPAWSQSASTTSSDDFGNSQTVELEAPGTDISLLGASHFDNP